MLTTAGGGDLVEMMKVASKTKNYAEVDEFIVNRLGNYMYNNGEGRLVPIDCVVMNRNRDRPKIKLVRIVAEATEDTLMTTCKNKDVFKVLPTYSVGVGLVGLLAARVG